MPASALALVILAGLIHACWNIVAKKVGGDARFAFFSGALLMLVWAPLGLWVSWQQVPDWGWPELGVVTVSGVLHVGYYLVLLRGYREADLTVVYPLARGSGPLLSSTMAILFLGEQLSAWGALGIAAVVGGVFLVAGGPSLLRAAHDPAKRQRVRSGVFFGLVTGIFIAAYTVVDGWGVKVLGMSPILVDYLSNVVRLVILLPVVASMRTGLLTVFRQQWKGALLVAAISPVSYVLVLYAMQVAPLSHVAPAREVSMLFAALIGGHLLSEGDRLLRVLGAACIAGGVMALAVG
ncbi:MAG: EamA family transporter [Lautropia sp.]|nr:EamA family transporter [Lautropia sp.]